jgi:hypothetical protein
MRITIEITPAVRDFIASHLMRSNGATKSQAEYAIENAPEEVLQGLLVESIEQRSQSWPVRRVS